MPCESLAAVVGGRDNDRIVHPREQGRRSGWEIWKTRDAVLGGECGIGKPLIVDR